MLGIFSTFFTASVLVSGAVATGGDTEIGLPSDAGALAEFVGTGGENPENNLGPNEDLDGFFIGWGTCGFLLGKGGVGLSGS